MRRQANSVAPGYTHLQLNHPFLHAFSTAFTAPGYDHSWAEQQFAAAHAALKTGALHDIHLPESYLPKEWGESDEDYAPRAAEHKRQYGQAMDQVRTEIGDHTLDNWATEQRWHSGMRRALTLGHLDIDEAKRRGFRPADSREAGERYHDYDSGETKTKGGWQPLPPKVYHVSTHADDVQRDGLKTREELGGVGTGLGGGHGMDQVSVTADHRLGPDIYHGLHEHHAYLNGKISTDQLLDYAKHPPVGKPFHDELTHTISKDVIEKARTGTEHYDLPTLSDYHKDKPGWQPASHFPEGHPLAGQVETWSRHLSPEEQLHARTEMYKGFAHIRGSQFGGQGHRNPLFMSNDPVAFAKTDPKQFGILHLKSHPGAQGFPLDGASGKVHEGADSGEWRTGSGSPFDVEKVDKPRPRHLDEFGLGDKTAAYETGPDGVRRSSQDRNWNVIMGRDPHDDGNAGPRQAPKPVKHQVEDIDHQTYSVRDVDGANAEGGLDTALELEGHKHEPQKATFRLQRVPVDSLRIMRQRGTQVVKGKPFTTREMEDQDEPDDEPWERQRLDSIREGGDRVPPIVVVKHGPHHVIVDGSHRAGVAMENGETHVPAFVTDRDSGVRHQASRLPKILYKGVSARALGEIQNSGGLQPSEMGESGPGVYLTHDHEYAKRYAGMGYGGGAVLHVEHSVQNPLVRNLDDEHDPGDRKYRNIQQMTPGGSINTGGALGRALAEQGHDAVETTWRGRHEIAVHDPAKLRIVHVEHVDGEGNPRTAALDDDDYRMQHRPPDRDGIPMHDMTVNLPDDVYTHPHYYSDMSEPSAQHAHREINRVRGRPDAKVHIYRALPAEHVHQGIRPGDWVTTSKDYARQHGTHAVDPKHDWPVIRATVRAGDLHTDGDDFREFGYNGEEAKRGQVAFKGGYHQEVRQHADGTIRQVQRQQGPLTGKGYSFTAEHDHIGGTGGTIRAWNHDDYAGHLHYNADGSPDEPHIAPEHQHLAEELTRRMRMKLPPRTSARAPGKVWYHGTSMEYAQDILDNGARKGLNVVTYQPSANGYARIQGKFHSDSGRAVVLEGHLDGDEEEHPWDRDREGKAHRGIAVTSRPHAFTPTHWHEVLPWERGEEPQTERHPISEPMRKQASTQMVRPSQVWDHIRTDVHPHRLDTIRDSVAHHGWQPDWNVADGPIKVSLDPPVVSNGSHRLHVLRELGRDEPIPMQVSAAKIPDAERTESVQHMLRHYRPTDFDTWHQVRRNINWDHPTVKSFVEDVKRNGVKRPIPVDYEADPPQVMNGHTRLLAAERAGLDSVPTRQHEGFMDPDDPDHMGRGPDDPQHWTNQEHWAKKASGPVLYHGSTQRFEKGTVLTPAQRTDGSIHSGDWVYATTDPESARYFASMHDSSPESDAPVHIHRVEPIGDIEPDGFPSERDRFSRGNYRAKALRVLDHHQVPGHWAKQASLSDEDRVSVAEQAMERGGHTGRSWHVPAMHQDDPARQEAQRPVHDFVNGVLSQYGRGPVRVSPSHWDLRSPGSGRALYDHTYGTIGLAGEDTNDLELLHEMAHAITGKHGHDREFQQAVHGLYRDHLGPEAAKTFVDVAWKGQRHEAVTENWPPHLTEREDKYGDTYPVNVSRSNPRGPVATESEAQAVGLVGPYYHGTSKRRAREIRSGGFRQPRLHNYEMEGAGNAEEVDLGNTHRTYFTDTHDDAMHFAQAHHGQDADVVTAYLHPDHMEHDKGGGWMPSVTVKDVTHATAIRPERKQAARDESELHRGVLLTTRVDELAKAHERGGMPAVHRHLHDLVTTHQQEISRSRSTDPGVGTHWTSDPGVARKFSQGWRFAGDRDSVPHTRSGYNNEVDIPIHLTGRVAPEHHVTDPDELSHHMVEGHGWEQDSIPKFLGQPLPPREQETLVRKGAPVDVTSVRAALPSHPDWVNHLRAAHDNWEHEDWGDQEHSWQTIGGPGHHQATRTTPHDRVFGPTYGLDIRLWKNDKLREPIRADIIARWRTFCLRHNYRDWSTWVKIVFFGSEASEWSGPGQIGNGDFDLSIGIEYERMRAANPAFETMADAEIAQQLTGEMFTELRDPAHVFPDTDGVFDQTWFANVLGWNIAVMRPYAAYDVIAQEWIVRPPHLPDWDLSKMPAPMRTILRAAETTARNTLKLPEPERTLQGARLYEMWHADRSNAFGPQGEGWYDLGNLREKWLDQLDLWAPLYQAHKRAENLQLADWSNTPHFGSMTAKDYEGEVGNRDHITRSEVGTLPVGAVAGLQGVKGERPGEHRHRQGQAWEDFKADIAANGVQKPIFITVDHGQEPRISEGNHRRDASVELGLPDIPAEVRYFGHAEHEGTVEERARYRTAALYHWAPKEYRDDIEQHGLDHTRSPLYNPDGHGPHGIFMHHTPELAHDWAPGVEQTHDLYEVDAQGMKLHPDPYDTGAASYTAQPVPPERIHRVGSTTIRYMRNNGGMRQNMPSGFGQEHEPWGRYMNHYDPDDPGMATDRETGTVEFGNPLHVEHDHGGWKQTLSEAHGGATGRALSDALLARGHDAVITHDKYGIGEIVDLRPRDQRTHVPDRLAALS